MTRPPGIHSTSTTSHFRRIARHIEAHSSSFYHFFHGTGV
jgi:hypothetical protein